MEVARLGKVVVGSAVTLAVEELVVGSFAVPGPAQKARLKWNYRLLRVPGHKSAVVQDSLA
jgi:hypothetical protein